MKEYNQIKNIYFFLLFFGSNVLGALGFANVNRIHGLVILAALMLTLFHGGQLKRNVPLFWLSAFVILFSMAKLYSDRGEGTHSILLTILGAPLIYLAFPYLSEKKLSNVFFWRKITYITIILYLYEVLLAIFERVVGMAVFGWHGVARMIASGSGRSTALYGHPLYNAFMVTLAMSFILISSLKVKTKIILWGMGGIAVLCFNARGCIVLNILLLFLYVLHEVFVNSKISNRIKSNITVASVIVAIIGLLLVSSGLVGGRLLELGVIDDSSAQVRIDALDFVLNTDINSILFGMSYDDYNGLLLTNDLSATENCWIDYYLRFGVVFLAFYVSLLFVVMWSELKGYAFFSKFLLLLAFFMGSSINNSLSTSFLALLYFFVLIRIFNPVHFGHLAKKRYWETLR